AEVDERQLRLEPPADDVVADAVRVDDASGRCVRRHRGRLLLLMETRALEAVRTALEGDQPVLHPRAELRPDERVVAHEVELGDVVIGPEDLVRVRDPDAVDYGSRHSRGSLSSRSPR